MQLASPGKLFRFLQLKPPLPDWLRRIIFSLKQRGDALLVSMERDEDAFLTRNIGEAERNTLRGMLEDFANHPDEVEGRGFVTAMVEKRDELAVQLRRQLSAVRNIAESCYGRRGSFGRFGFRGMQKLDENGLHRLARRVVNIGTELLAELAAKGLTEEMLSAVQATNTAFDAAIDAVYDAGADSELHTEMRIEKGNAIWAIMAGFALAGKGLFQDSDEARYRSYVLES